MAYPARVSGGEEDDRTPRLSGQAVLDSRWAFQRVIGEEAFARALASLPSALRQEYLAVTPLTWVPYDVMRDVHDAFGLEAGEPVETLLERVIPLAMERSFSTVWRVFMRMTSDAALIQRTPLVYRRSRNRGTMTARLVAPGEGEVVLTDWASIPPRDVHALGISIATFVRLSGRKDVTIEGEKTPSGGRWRVRWRA